MDIEEKLRILEERTLCLEAIVDRINEGVLLTDRECKIAVFNPAKEQMEQLCAADVLGKYSWEPYAHSNHEISEHRRVFDSHTPIVNAYRPHAYIDDMPVYIYYSTYPVIRDGEVIGVYSISRNETILKRLLYETLEQKRRLTAANLNSAETITLAEGTHFYFSNIVGTSKAITDVIHEAQTVATMDTSLLIVGETGTGKEVFAQSIHNLSRPDKKFAAINCAAIPENLVESILFGSKKGAYTGAVDSTGLFEEAGEGTLFLDEVNSMSPLLQGKLLRALQERCVRPVGSSKEIPIKCRLIFASNEQPQVLLEEKRMRQDLFYRIAGFCLFIPPLRERREDIIELADYFIRRCNKKFQKNVKSISDDLRNLLWQNDWPGNTRELQHFMENMMLRAPETATVLTPADIPNHLKTMTNADRVSAQQGPVIADCLETQDLNGTLTRIQHDIVLERLKRYDFNMTKTANSLGILRQNLLVRMKRLKIEKPQPEK